MTLFLDAGRGTQQGDFTQLVHLVQEFFESGRGCPPNADERCWPDRGGDSVAAVECMAESFTLADKHGSAREQMAESLSETLFGGGVYKGYGAQVAKHEYEPAGFRPRLGWKDVGLVLQVGADREVPLPVGPLLRDRLLTGLAKGRADLDWSAIALGCSEAAGLVVRRT